jgi:hypothetical protein
MDIRVHVGWLKIFLSHIWASHLGVRSGLDAIVVSWCSEEVLIRPLLKYSNVNLTVGGEATHHAIGELSSSKCALKRLKNDRLTSLG